VPLAKPSSRNPTVVSRVAPQGPEYWSQLHAIGQEAGLHSLGVAPADVMHRARLQIQNRIDHDLVNDMKFTFLRPERSTTPAQHLDGAQSIIVGVRSYAINDHSDVGSSSPLARVARYAWLDHYGHLKDSLSVVAERIIMVTSKIRCLSLLNDYARTVIALSYLQMTMQWLIAKRHGWLALVGLARTQIFCCQVTEASLFLGA